MFNRVKPFNDGIGQWLTKSLDEHLSGNRDQRAPSSLVFHPSSLGNPCDRFLYLHYRGLLVEQKISPQLRRIFDHGFSMQDRYRKYFERMGIFIAEEIPAKIGSPSISGRADFILRGDDGRKIVADTKTINDFGFSHLREAKKEHVVQVQIYLNILNVNDGLLIYENKDNQAIKIFDVLRDRKVWEDILTRCRKVMAMSDIPTLSSLPNDHDRKCQCLLVA